MRAMRILIANDDGYLAPGLAALVQAMQGLGEIDVFAPEQNASGTSNALTLSRPLNIFEARGEHVRGFRVVNGTPSDSVHVALTGVLGHRPDLVLSGINNGANMGDDTVYSGTVAAAMEGYLFGVPAIAFSQAEKGWAHLDAAAAAARAIVEQVDLLDRAGRRCARGWRGHRLPRRGQRPHFDHAAAGGPDRPCGPPRLGGAAGPAERVSRGTLSGCTA